MLRASPAPRPQCRVYGNQVKVLGVSQDVESVAFDGPSSWIGYALIAGHWYDAPARST